MEYCLRWKNENRESWSCLLYTSDAADEEDSVDLGGRRNIKKKKDEKKKKNDAATYKDHATEECNVRRQLSKR